jgi:tetratricopeptide (TPR) repeat protein
MYICPNPTCAISISKATFPAAMPCPVCQTMLTAESSLNDVELALLQNLPYVIAYPLQKTLEEKHAWTKINLFKDTFLNYLKYLGLLTASEFFNSPFKDKRMVALFQQSLSEPSFGTWNQYIRETLAFLKEKKHSFFIPELPEYYEKVETGKKRKLYKGEIEFIDGNGDVQIKKQEATAIGMLINFRNRFLGHGLTLDATTAEKLWEEYSPMFFEILRELKFTQDYKMYKYENDETFLLQSAQIVQKENNRKSNQVWLESPTGEVMDILPFYVVPGELTIRKEDKEQILAYESYTGKSIKFFSPEGTEKQTSGRILEKLNLLLRDKQKEKAFSSEEFTKEIFLSRVAEENKLILDTLIAEKKVIPGVYVHREDMEIKLREWIGARANIFVIAAEAGSGKTNLLVEMQKQYTERELPTLLIRAGRMEKTTIHAQLCYLLNIDEHCNLNQYPAIGGTQEAPTFVLIDGLNEALESEKLWTELFEISKHFEPGSLKFVITSRANSKVDLNRHTFDANDKHFIYGKNNQRENDLGDYAHWLTTLNMAEIKSAWENYSQNERNKYKPLFLFDDLAAFDRALYNQISNPLILRLFLETYHNKSLPKKGNKQLNIWADWLANFSEDEIIFLKYLSQAVWDKGVNELLLDDLLSKANLKPYLTTDIINAPYHRLKNIGWITRFTKELNVYLSFTVEGALLYIMGAILKEQQLYTDIEIIKSTLKKGSKIQQSAIEVLLSQLSLLNDLKIPRILTDAGQEYQYACVNPLILYIRNYGVKSFVDFFFTPSNVNYWYSALLLSNTLSDLEEKLLRKEFLIQLMPLNTFVSKPEIEIGIKTCDLLDWEQAHNYVSIIDKNCNSNDLSTVKVELDSFLLVELGHLELHYGNYDQALNYYKKSLEIDENKFGKNIDIGTTYYFIGTAYSAKSEYIKAIEYFEKAINTYRIFLDENHIFFFRIYNDLGLLLGSIQQNNKALLTLEKSLQIAIKNHGTQHSSVAAAYNNLGVVWHYMSEREKVLPYFEKCLEITLAVYGENHLIASDSYLNIGHEWKLLGNNEKALSFYEKSLRIRLLKLGDKHPKIADTYLKIGDLFNVDMPISSTIEYYEKALNIYLDNLDPNHDSIANLYNSMGNYYRKISEFDKAIEFCEKSCEIYINTFGDQHPWVFSIYNNIGKIYRDKGDKLNALDFLLKGLNGKLTTLADNHLSLTHSYNSIAILYENLEDYDKALDYYEKCLQIELNNFGDNNINVANSYKNIGNVWESKGHYSKAIEFFQNALDIEIKVLKEDHSEVAMLYLAIGECYQNSNDFDSAIQAFKSGFSFSKTGRFPYRIAECMENLNEYDSAFRYFLQSAEIKIEDHDLGIEAESTQESIKACIRLAKELGKESELPNWIKENK